MWGVVLAVGLVFLGQVGDRYLDTNTAGGQQSTVQEQALDSNDAGLLQMLDSTTADADSVPPSNAAPLPRIGTDVYGSGVATPGGASARNLPSSSGATSPTARGTSPAFGAQQNQPATRATRAVAEPPFATTSIEGVKPSALMREMLAPPPSSQLSGQPMSLAEVVATATSRAEQTQRVEAYWDLCSSVADYYLGLHEHDELRQLISEAPQIGPALQQAQRDQMVRIGTSQRAALTSQYRLASLLGMSSASLPLPRDVPHCGNYHSHYQQIFAGRPSVEARELSALLPMRYAELKNAAVAVHRAEEFVLSVASATNPNSDRAGIVNALQLLALHRRAFVQIARDYNRRIARYTELATPGEVDSNRLVGMLIMPSGQPTATRNMVPGGPPSRQSNNAEIAPKNVFADDWEAAGTAGGGASTIRDSQVTPATAESEAGPRQEHSLMVK